MKASLKMSLFALVGASVVGCQFYARAPEDYAKETQAILSTKSDQIKSCYDKVLETNKKAKGIVAVSFKVERKTGKIVDASIDDKKTTAPKELGTCVIEAMNGLSLDPPDQRDGLASFEYEFKANAPKQL